MVVAAKGDTVRFTNLDSLAQHDLSSDIPHLFTSKLIGTGQSEVVQGVDKLPPGSYQFHCSIHSWMHGVLNVEAVGAGLPGVQPGSPPPGTSPDNGVNPVDLVPKVPPAPLEGGGWPFYGRDLANSRDGGPTGPSYNEVATLGPVWSFESKKGDFTGTPVISRGTLVAGAGDGTVYALDASTGRKRWSRATGAPINGTAAISGGRVFVPLATVGAPAIAALRLSDGKQLWRHVLDRQKDADMFGSPVVWSVPARHRRDREDGGRDRGTGDDGRPTVFVGVSAEYGEVNDPNVAVRGSVVALDARTGKVRWKRYAVPPHRDGGAVWSTPAIDTRTKRVYVGTGNAYHAPAADTTDSILALDTRSGKITGHFQATAQDVWNETGNKAAGPDYDFGASPNLIADPLGRPLVGEGQKSGTYWAVDRRTMRPDWNVFTAHGAPAVGGIVGSTAYDGTRIFGPDTPAGEVWAASRTGSLDWVSSDGGPLQFSAVSVANGVAYTTNLSGTLTARDVATGAPLAKLPLGAPSWGGVAIAGGYVFAVTGTSGTIGYIVAYRPRD
ncbi:MAG: PQQ-binding-like beta-propeller repeat protein [Actinobacteria bacterium]|nr:PQQ-binding-like beta-propeller repeat protein [Actinomycetota bacterium]